MGVLNGIEPVRVFKFFEEICAIPHGSGNMEAISAYCESFAKDRDLEYLRDNNNNVFIRKRGSAGCEDAAPLLLQGHLGKVETAGRPAGTC